VTGRAPESLPAAGERIRRLLVLARIQTAGVTTLTGVFGALANRSQGRPEPIVLAGLFLIGLCAHLHGFITNELADTSVDRLSPDLADKPLVSGAISRRTAWIAAWIPALIAYVVIALVFRNIWLWLLFLVGHLGEYIYNFHGKSFPGSDFFLALWASTFCLFGALAVHLPAPWSPHSWSAWPGPIAPLAWIVALLGGLQIFFNNAIEGGIKDCDHDLTAGARTLAAFVLGARVTAGQLHLPRRFRITALCLKLPALLLAALPLLLPEALHYAPPGRTQIVLHAILTLLALITLGAFLRDQPFDRPRLKRIFSLHEIAVTFLVPLLLLPVAGAAWTWFLVLFPLSWYLLANRLLYGTFLHPRA